MISATFPDGGRKRREQSYGRPSFYLCKRSKFIEHNRLASSDASQVRGLCRMIEDASEHEENQTELYAPDTSPCNANTPVPPPFYAIPTKRAHPLDQKAIADEERSAQE